jgi:acetyl/propionyl-CoA carboxylase alpha subunit
VYSQVGSRSLHVREADESAFLGGSRPEESYLAKEKIIDAAIAHGCQAIHPGYGFLSENADFVDMVSKAGLVFIGPPADVIRTLGDKMTAKTFAEKLGIPIKSGPKECITTFADAQKIAQEIGFPLMMRPTRAGGGRGIRVVDSKADLRHAVEACQNEARKAFGYRSSPISTAMLFTWGRGNVPSRDGIKKSLKRALRRPLMTPCAGAWEQWRALLPGRQVTRTREPLNLFLMIRIRASISWK